MLQLRGSRSLFRQGKDLDETYKLKFEGALMEESRSLFRQGKDLDY